MKNQEEQVEIEKYESAFNTAIFLDSAVTMRDIVNSYGGNDFQRILTSKDHKTTRD